MAAWKWRSQIIKVLKEVEGGRTAKSVCRECGIATGTYYTWKSKYGGMEVAEAKRLMAMEDDNGKLKRLLADAMLDVSTLKEMLGKNF